MSALDCLKSPMLPEPTLTRAERKRTAWRADQVCPLCQLLIAQESIEEGTLISYNAEKPGHLRLAHGACAEFWIRTGQRPSPVS